MDSVTLHNFAGALAVKVEQCAVGAPSQWPVPVPVIDLALGCQRRTGSIEQEQVGASLIGAQPFDCDSAAILRGSGIDEPFIVEPLRAEATPLIIGCGHALLGTAVGADCPNTQARRVGASLVDGEGDCLTIGGKGRLGAR